MMKMDYSQSQSMSQRSREPMSEKQLAAATIKVKDYLLSDMKHLRKFKKDEIVVNALNKSSRQYKEIIERVKNIFQNVFGFRFATLPNKSDEFIMVNINSSKYLETMQQNPLTGKERDETLVLNFALASILMNKGTMYESHLLRMLDKIGFMKDSFYDAKERKSKDFIPKLFGNFVKQMYLEGQKVDRPKQRVYPPLPDENKVTQYQWGYRALVEVDVDNILEHILQIHNGRRPYFFPSVHFTELKERQNKLRSELQL